MTCVHMIAPLCGCAPDALTVRPSAMVTYHNVPPRDALSGRPATRAATPIVKWAGGKTRLLSELLARMPREFGTYFEPFVGGGALFFAACPAKAVLGDMNYALIKSYRAVAEYVESVVGYLEDHKRLHSRDHYYDVRDWWNNGEFDDEPIAGAAAFIYLNKTCFNGLWRVNRSGGFNVPMGDYVNPTIVDAVGLRAASAVLGRTRLVVGEYTATTVDAVAGDFVYFDPPYDPVSKTSNFTAYTKDAFGKQQQEQLAEHARALRERGVQVMLSNNDTEFVRSLYADFHIDTVKCARSINSKGGKRGAVSEVIVTSYPPTGATVH